MGKTSTTNDLILYLYNETPLTETVLIQKDIDTDPATEAEFESLKKAQHLLDCMLERPANSCLRSIMRYSGRTSRGRKSRAVTH